MTSEEIRKRFIGYFTTVLASRSLAHTEIASSSLVPENHPTLLFTNSGMVQFTPYFLGIKDPLADFKNNRLCSVQKCIRTGDLQKVGSSKYHLTFFEMLGSWSIGDYGKAKAVELSFDLLTNKEYGFGFDPSKFIPTVFAGSPEAECDTETIEAWKAVGIPDNRISKLPASENWWAPGGLTGPGPCGPCTEVLYDRGPTFGPEESEPGMTDNPRYLEIWNAGVFMQYNRDEEGKLHPLPSLSVDTGAGLERFAVLLQNVDSVYETDLFTPIINKIIDIQKQSSLLISDYGRADIREAIWRIADHVRASTFMIAEYVYPANKDQGYVLRRMLRTIFHDAHFTLGIAPEKVIEIVPVIIETYGKHYPEISAFDHIASVFSDEVSKYTQVVKQAKHVIKRNYQYKHLPIDAFDVYQSTGATLEVIEQIAQEEGLEVNREGFDEKLEGHQKKSRSAAEGKFKGGLSGDDPEQRKLHTATHLLHRALRDVLGDQVQQMGSNITPQRLRFDFSHPTKVTPEELEKVSSVVNEKIAQALPVQSVKLSKSDAEASGALHFFKEKYPDTVTVYFIGDSLDTAWSKEFCGGPHVTNTKDIGAFRIVSEEAVGKGVRRIKAVVRDV